jgi:Type IV secretion system pilin
MRAYKAVSLFGITGVLISSFPALALAAGDFTFSPIIPTTGACSCPGSAPDYGCILQTIQHVINLGISFGVIILTLYIAYAGILYVTNPNSPGKRSEGNQKILNGVIGLVVILSSWLIVDFVMKTLYNPDTAFDGQRFGPWNSILAPRADGGDYCIVPNNDTGNINTTIQGVVTALTSAPISSGSAGGGSAVSGTGRCAPGKIASNAAAGGYQLTQAQANTLSCIAIPESSCGTNTSVPRTTAGSQTSARGMFQIILGLNDTCHSLNIPVCTQAAQAAGYKVSGSLNCGRAFSNGRVKAGMESLAAACTAAAQNDVCNTSAAACLVRNNPSFSDWAGDSRATAQRACIAKFRGQ